MKDPTKAATEAVGGDGDVRGRLEAVWARHARAGLPLPSEVALAERVGASRPRVREELIRMESEGLLRRDPNQGTFPNPFALDARMRIDLRFDFAEILAKSGFEQEIRVESAGWGELDEAEAESLGGLPGASCFRTRKVWWGGGRPRMVATDVIPVSRRDEPLDPRQPVYELVRRLRGVEVVWERLTLRPVAAEGDDAGSLQMSAGQPALRTQILGASRHGDSLFAAQETHRVEGDDAYTMLRQTR